MPFVFHCVQTENGIEFNFDLSSWGKEKGSAFEDDACRSGGWIGEYCMSIVILTGNQVRELSRNATSSSFQNVDTKQKEKRHFEDEDDASETTWSRRK
jgi:hypothetical protein